MFLPELTSVTSRLLIVSAVIGSLAYQAQCQDTIKPPKPRNTLKLTVSLNKTKTIVDSDGNSEPLNVKLTFANVSESPVKLDMYDSGPHLSIDVVGLKSENVQLIERPFKERDFPRPAATDFPIIPPGKTWTLDRTLMFPQSSFRGPTGGAEVSYQLLKHGVYRIRFSYTSNWQFSDEMKAFIDATSWNGQIESNDIELTVLPTD